METWKTSVSEEQLVYFSAFFQLPLCLLLEAVDLHKARLQYIKAFFHPDNFLMLIMQVIFCSALRFSLYMWTAKAGKKHLNTLYQYIKNEKSVDELWETTVALQNYFASCIYFVDSVYVRIVLACWFYSGDKMCTIFKVCFEFLFTSLLILFDSFMKHCMTLSVMWHTVWDVCNVLNKSSVYVLVLNWRIKWRFTFFA